MKSLIPSWLVSSYTILFSPLLLAQSVPQTPSISQAETDPQTLLNIVSSREQTWENQDREHLNRDFSATIVTPEKVEQSLKEARATTQTKAALIWLNSYPNYLRITISTANSTQNYEVDITRNALRQPVKQP